MAWSLVSSGSRAVQGDMDHVTAEGGRPLRALVDVGGAPDGDQIRRCEWWSVVIDDSVRAVSWTFRGREEHDLNSISNYAGEAEAYFGRLNAEHLHQPSSPARIAESYVQGSATKETAVAFGVGKGVHVYALPDRANGVIRPTRARVFNITTAQIGSTPTGWFMVDRLGNLGKSDPAIVFVDDRLEPAGIVRLPADFHSYLESAGDAAVVFDGNCPRAWVVAGHDLWRIRWSALVRYGHIAATSDRRSLFLTDGMRVATALESIRVSPDAAEGLPIGETTLVVSRGTKTRLLIALLLS
ncbi:MAG TPA: hypothetical protein VHU41_01410, partial [Thermoanaerobaculia bacterium]|nr:hypothetical protein [Thermoanaerobaculia bacterium]